jgi:hypothetical protein
MSIVNTFCYLWLLIAVYGISFSFLYFGILLISIKNFHLNKEAWVVNGTDIIVTESLCCSNGYIVNIHGYRYVDIDNHIVRRCTYYSKQFATEITATKYANSQQPGDIHHWIEKDSICYTEVINRDEFAIMIAILICIAFFICLINTCYVLFMQGSLLRNVPVEAQ